MCGQWEIGSRTGRSHFQGCVRFANPLRKSTVKRLDREKRTHWIVGDTYQNIQQCFEYTTKSETSVSRTFKLGDWSIFQGARTDLNDLKEVIDQNLSTCDPCGDGLNTGVVTNPLLTCYDTLFNQTVRYHRGLQMYIDLKRSECGRRVNDGDSIVVEVHYGDPGTGKSLQAHRRFPHAYRHESTHGVFWGAGATAYQGQKVVIFDDFTTGSYPFNPMKRILDRYPVDVSTKGSATPMKATHFIFTSNLSPREWYGDEFDKSTRDYDAFRRRITSIVEYRKTIDGIVRTHMNPTNDRIIRVNHGGLFM